ncbi:MAG: hypothetical protein SF182_04100 [Deltaproteobacteria bacterium]|nr:hypothetical protein [Deltaproteobacteria bacterium]
MPAANPTAADSPPIPRALVQRIEERLRRHLAAGAVVGVREAVLRGQVVHLNAEKGAPLVAYKRGVLFVAGKEYVIDDD